MPINWRIAMSESKKVKKPAKAAKAPKAYHVNTAANKLRRIAKDKRLKEAATHKFIERVLHSPNASYHQKMKAYLASAREGVPA